MTFRNRILFICFAIVCLVALIFQWIRHVRPLAPPDSGIRTPVMQVLVKHKPRDCRCPDWEVVKTDENSISLHKGSLIFIEAANPAIALSPESLGKADRGYLIQLHGEIDQEERVPAGTADSTMSHTEKGPVFVYTSGEFIKQE